MCTNLPIHIFLKHYMCVLNSPISTVPISIYICLIYLPFGLGATEDSAASAGGGSCRELREGGVGGAAPHLQLRRDRLAAGGGGVLVHLHGHPVPTAGV